MTPLHDLTAPHEPLPLTLTLTARLAPLTRRALTVRSWATRTDPATMDWGQRQRVSMLQERLDNWRYAMRPRRLAYRTRRAARGLALAAGLIAPAPRPVVPRWENIAYDLAHGREPTRPRVFDVYYLRALLADDADQAVKLLARAADPYCPPVTPDDVETVLTAWKAHADPEQQWCRDGHPGPPALGHAPMGRTGWTLKVALCKRCAVPIYTVAPPATLDGGGHWEDIWSPYELAPPEPGDPDFLDYLCGLHGDPPQPGDRGYPEHLDRLEDLTALGYDDDRLGPLDWDDLADPHPSTTGGGRSA